MDRALYGATSEGKVDILRQHIDQLRIQTTVHGNSALHVAAQFGQLHSVAEILQVCPSLLRRSNIRGETPLHMAAREGYVDIVKALIECAKTIEQELESGLGGAAKKMLRATNVDGDTALHVAVRNCHFEEDKYLEVVKLLIREDPEFQHPANNDNETPLYLAAERGNHGVALVFTLLETCISPTYGGPVGRTALHAATFNDFTGQSIRRLLEWKKDLIEEVDTCGWTPLHCAAYNGNEEGVKQLLQTDESVVYVTTKKKDGLETALHMATARGHVRVMEELLSFNPDCWEMVNSKGQNVLHIAVDMEDESAIKFILNKPWLRHVINQKDNEGNTPLHLLNSSDCEVHELWKHNRADQHAFNNENMTPTDLVWSTFEDARIPTSAETLFVDCLLDSQNLGGRNIVSNVHDHIAKLKRTHKYVKERRKIIDEAEKQREKTKEEETRSREEAEKQKEKTKQEEMRAREQNAERHFQTLIIVAALIATITFAAAFAIPGGYDGNQGRHQGLAVLAKTAAFQAFVVTNTIAVSPRSFYEQISTMAASSSPSTTALVKSPSPSSNLSLLISNLNAFVSVKLDTTNFIIWKSQWQNILKATGLYSFVDGTGVSPPAKIRNFSDQEITNPDFLQWMVDDAHLMSCISGTLSSIIYPVVIHCGTSLETWSNIEKRFTTLSRSHVHQLKNRLTATTKGSNTMEGYLQQIKTLNDQLTLAGSQVDIEDLVLITLNGLSDEYRAFKTSIRTRSSPITMEELCSLLLSEAIHEETPVKSQSSSDVNVAFVASRGGYSHQGNRGFSYPNRGSRGGFRGNIRGGRYNQRRGGFRNGNNGNRSSYSGHPQGSAGYTRSSSSSPNSQSSYGSSSGSVVCQICDKPGHTAYDCWHRLNMDYQPNSSHTSHTKAFVASMPEQSNSSNWYVDSAASTHMTNDLSNLSIYEPYQGGEQVTVGNGTTLPIHNTGNGQGPQTNSFSGPAY